MPQLWHSGSRGTDLIPVGSLAREIPYAMGTAKKKKKAIIGQSCLWLPLGDRNTIHPTEAGEGGGVVPSWDKH